MGLEEGKMHQKEAQGNFQISCLGEWLSAQNLLISTLKTSIILSYANYTSYNFLKVTMALSWKMATHGCREWGRMPTSSFPPPFPTSLIFPYFRQPNRVSPAWWKRAGYKNTLAFSPECWPDTRAHTAGGVEVWFVGWVWVQSPPPLLGSCRCSDPSPHLILSHPPHVLSHKGLDGGVPWGGSEKRKVIKHLDNIITKTSMVMFPERMPTTWISGARCVWQSGVWHHVSLEATNLGFSLHSKCWELCPPLATAPGHHLGWELKPSNSWRLLVNSHSSTGRSCYFTLGLLEGFGCKSVCWGAVHLCSPTHEHFCILQVLRY